ncbi:DEAD/DEAH box helicase [Streptomyces sp. CA-253872]|uniref:DEAD/DEAH box helicase n=1 Tax=Streptomyces sp. CA-253872 TaxID=3240067 RepID=UPI003D8C6E93
MGREEREAYARARSLARAAEAVRADWHRAVTSVRAAVDPLLDAEVAALLAPVPLARLQEVTRGRLRTADVEAAGYTTIGALREAGEHALRRVPGVGAGRARQLAAAAGRFADTVREALTVRLDADRPTPGTTALLHALHPLVTVGTAGRATVAEAEEWAARLREPLAVAAPLDAAWPRAAARSLAARCVPARGRAREAARAALAELRALVAEAAGAGLGERFAQTSADLLRTPGSQAAAWLDFALRAADYHAVLAAAAGLDPGSAAAAGDLPAEIAEEVRRQPLDERHVRVTLRPYQSFGARFALARRRVLLGDEMGLGKSVQAIAVLAHLMAEAEDRRREPRPPVDAGALTGTERRLTGFPGAREDPPPTDPPGAREDPPPAAPPGASGEPPATGPGGPPSAAGTRALVVCPTSLLVNWQREFAAHSALPVHVLYGPGRAHAYQEWRAGAGVGLTTYTTLAKLPLADASQVATVVLDEAQYVKNHRTQRAGAAREWTRQEARRVLLLSGTPMEHRPAELAALVGLLDETPHLTGPYAPESPHAFRAALAPVYLRREQADVLAELPGVQHTREWLVPGPAENAAYRAAVVAGSFPAMRRAAFAGPEPSAKAARLRDLVAEAAANGRKTLVFSYFPDVLDAVRAHLPPDVPVHGPVTGTLDARARQDLVDAFTTTDGPAVLLAPIRVAGLGLNLQAASVVVLCEPQTSTALESQAVARAHRMGQARSVRVHHLLTPGGIDTHLLGVQEERTHLFDTHARRSVIAESIPEATDTFDAEIARRIVAEERGRLGVAEAEGNGGGTGRGDGDG